MDWEDVLAKVKKEKPRIDVKRSSYNGLKNLQSHPKKQ